MNLDSSLVPAGAVPGAQDCVGEGIVMYIPILMLIVLALICLFVGSVIGYGICYWLFVRALGKYDLFG